MDLHHFIHFADADALALLTERINTMAETVATLKAKFDALKTASDAERAEVLVALQAIKDQIPAAGTATQADLDALGSLLDAQITRTQSIITTADSGGAPPVIPPIV